jgi:hypothetical protein
MELHKLLLVVTLSLIQVPLTMSVLVSRVLEYIRDISRYDRIYYVIFIYDMISLDMIG